MDTTSRSNGKKNGKGSRAKPHTEQDISWIEGSCDKTPVAFFDKFGIPNCEEGHRRYTTALRRSALCEKERTLLIDNFEAWKSSESLLYWERRKAKMIAQTSAWKTAGNIIRGSEPFVETVIAENAKEQRQHFTMPSDSSLASHTQGKSRFRTAEGPSVIDQKVHKESPEVPPSRLLRTPSYHSESEVASFSPVSTPLLLRRDPPLPSSDTEADLPYYSDDVDPAVTLKHYKVLNQKLAWIVEKVDLVEQFHAFRPQHLHDFSLARDGIADMRHGSKFRTFLAPHIAATAGKVEPTTTSIYKKWPTLEGIITRVFAKNHYEDVSKAVRGEDLHDPVVAYILYVVLSYLNYFTFHDEIPNDLNEREGFIDLVWVFIRGAMTLARIETRSLEVLITGVQERKNHDKDPFIESKQVGQYADGLAFCGSSQLYLSEASTIHNPKADKCVRDEFKLARAMRDSWISQIRSTCRENVPHQGMAVFGSISNKDETKLLRLDFNGVFRLMQFDAFLVPLKNYEFGVKAKAAVTRCLELALRVQEEIDARLQDVVVVNYEERIKLEDAANAIEITTASPSKSRTKRCWSESI